MSDPHAVPSPSLPLALPPEARFRPAPDGQVAIGLHVFYPEALVELLAFPGTRDAVRGALETALGIDIPAAPRAAPQSDGRTVMAHAPDRFLLLSRHADDREALVTRLEEAVEARTGAVVDLSAARIGFHLDGPAAPFLLQKGVAVDMDLFEEGTVHAAALHGIGVTIRRDGPDAFTILAMATFAQSALDWFIEAASDLGIRVHMPGRPAPAVSALAGLPIAPPAGLRFKTENRLRMAA